MIKYQKLKNNNENDRKKNSKTKNKKKSFFFSKILNDGLPNFGLDFGKKSYKPSISTIFYVYAYGQKFISLHKILEN